MSLVVNIIAAVAVIAAFITFGLVGGVIAFLVGGIIAIRVASMERATRETRRR